MKIMLGNFNAKMGGEKQLEQQKKMKVYINNNNGIRFLYHNKNLIVKLTTFIHKNNHKATWVFSHHITFSQIHHVLVDKRKYDNMYIIIYVYYKYIY